LKLNKLTLFFCLFGIILFIFPNTIFANYISPYPEPTSLIRYGNYGSNVKWVQDMLNHNGFSLSVDGDFGNKTLSAVKSFQSKHGLTVDGIVGVATKTSLKNNCKASITTTQSTQTMYTTSNLNLRKGASTSYSIILTIPKGSKVTIVTNNSNGWSLVKYNTTYGFVSTKYLSSTNPVNPNTSTSASNQNTQTNILPTFSRNTANFINIIKNCKNYYANNKFYYSTAAGVRTIPADKSKIHDSSNCYYTDCSCYVSWVLYEYALANNNKPMQDYFSYQRNSATFKTIGDNGGNSYLSVVSKKTSTSNVNLSSAKPGDILVSPGHVEFFNSYTLNSNGTITLTVYNCGSTSSIQIPGVTYSATKNLGDITYILRVKA